MFTMRDDHFKLTITSHFAIVYRQLRIQIYLARPIHHSPYLCVYKSVIGAGKANDCRPIRFSLSCQISFSIRRIFGCVRFRQYCLQIILSSKLVGVRPTGIIMILSIGIGPSIIRVNQRRTQL